MWPSSRTREPIRILGRKEVLSAAEGGGSEFKWEDHGDLVKGEVEAGSKKEWSGSGSVSIKGRMLSSEFRYLAGEGRRVEIWESSKPDLLSLLKALLLVCSEKTRAPLDEPPPPTIVGFS